MKLSENIRSENLPQTLINKFEGPVLFSYVWWVLMKTQERGIKTLYFLSRDGYLLKEIAQEFCNRFALPIECRYLYCSRVSLRLPSYHLIGEKSYYFLLESGCYITFKKIMKQINLTDEESKIVCSDCEFSWKEKDRVLGKKEFQELSKRLKNSSAYKELVMKKSKEAYQTTSEYLRQEIPLDSPKIAIVDSGWLGSMQFFLSQLLHSMGFQGEIEGFYFGLYKSPSDPQNGKYNAWYFDTNTNIRGKAEFCNNLFECLLSAPHGMTTKYSYRDNKFMPVLEPAQNYSSFFYREKKLLQYTRNRLETTIFQFFQENEQKSETQKLIKRYMMYPTKQEARYYGDLRFSADITESSISSLASPDKELLQNCLISRRILSFFKISKKNRPIPYWPYGAIAFLPEWKKWWYRKNVYWWEWMRCQIMSKNS